MNASTSLGTNTVNQPTTKRGRTMADENTETRSETEPETTNGARCRPTTAGMRRRQSAVALKPLEQLGISPAPWSNTINAEKPFEANSVWDARNGGILTGGYGESLNDARLIAAAPDLYKCLREATMAVCGMCLYCSVHQSYKCKAPKRKCAAKAWRTALSDAADGKSAKTGRASSNTHDKEGDSK